jgi:hypothetical protein
MGVDKKSLGDGRATYMKEGGKVMIAIWSLACDPQKHIHLSHVFQQFE